MQTHPHTVPEFTLVNALAAVAIAFIFITAMSTARQKVNADPILALWSFLGAPAIFDLFRKQTPVTA